MPLPAFGAILETALDILTDRQHGHLDCEPVSKLLGVLLNSGRVAGLLYWSRPPTLVCCVLRGHKT